MTDRIHTDELVYILLAEVATENGKLHERIERECWKQHHADFKVCDMPTCRLLREVASLAGWTIDVNGVTPFGPSTIRQVGEPLVLMDGSIADSKGVIVSIADGLQRSTLVVDDGIECEPKDFSDLNESGEP